MHLHATYIDSLSHCLTLDTQALQDSLLVSPTQQNSLLETLRQPENLDLGLASRT
jgi:hypothetical protein